MTCLHLAAKTGGLTSCCHILDSGLISRNAINDQDEGGWTPLVWASENRYIKVVRYFDSVLKDFISNFFVFKFG